MMAYLMFLSMKMMTYCTFVSFHLGGWPTWCSCPWRWWPTFVSFHLGGWPTWLFCLGIVSLVLVFQVGRWDPHFPPSRTACVPHCQYYMVVFGIRSKILPISYCWRSETNELYW
jgi:hypothetical protein